MATLKCQLVFPEFAADEAQALTVGREFGITCPKPAELSAVDSLKLEVPEEAKYVLKLLRAQDEGGQLQLVVTSYRPGDHNLDKITLKSSEGTWTLEPLQWQVASVIEPSETKPEPYGPIGPVMLGWPASWWVGLALIAALLIASIVGAVFRWRRVRAFRRELEAMASMGSPSGEFYQRLRGLRRRHSVFLGAPVSVEEAREIAAEMDQMLRHFLTRRLEIPVARMRDAHVVRALRAHFEEEAQRLTRLFRELKFSSAAKVEPKDLIQLAEDAQSLVEVFDREDRKPGGRK